MWKAGMYRHGLPLIIARFLPAPQRVIRPCNSPGNRHAYVLPFQLICLPRLLSNFSSALFQFLSNTICTKAHIFSIFLVHFPYIVPRLSNKAYCTVSTGLYTLSQRERWAKSTVFNNFLPYNLEDATLLLQESKFAALWWKKQLLLPSTNNPYCIISAYCKKEGSLSSTSFRIRLSHSWKGKEPDPRALKVMPPPMATHKDHNSVRAQHLLSSQPPSLNFLFFPWQRTCFWTGLTRLESKSENLLQHMQVSSPSSNQQLDKVLMKLQAVKWGMLSHSQGKRTGVSRGHNTADNHQKHVLSRKS